MPNLMQSGAAWLGAQLRSHAGRSVSVRQGVTTIAGLTGWCGLQDYQVTSAEGFGTVVKSYDWEFVVDDLPTGFEFRSGAIITEGSQDYEVMPIGDLPCAENLDTSGLLLTVHTKQVK